MAAARVAPGSELADERVGPEVLSVWLVSGGETFGYLVDLTATPPGLTLVSAPPWLRDRA